VERGGREGGREGGPYGLFSTCQGRSGGLIGSGVCCSLRRGRAKGGVGRVGFGGRGSGEKEGRVEGGEMGLRSLRGHGASKE